MTILATIFAGVHLTAGPTPANAQSRSETAAPALSTEQIRYVQEMLRVLGYNPGPADGVPGARTVAAISEFQRKVGVAVTGRADARTYYALSERINKLIAVSPAAGSPADRTPADRERVVETPTGSTVAPGVETPIAPAGSDPASTDVSGSEIVSAATVPNLPIATDRLSSVANTKWEFVDENGSRQVVQFLPDGAVAVAGATKYWQWQMRDDEILIQFDNETGGWVRRVGRFVSPDRIEGSAQSSRNRSWGWNGFRR